MEMTRKRVKCSYCGSTWYIEVEHPIPKSRGGVKIVPACARCNRSKGTKTPAEWLDYLMAYDRPLWRKIRDYQKYKRSNFAEMVRRRRKKE